MLHLLSKSILGNTHDHFLSCGATAVANPLAVDFNPSTNPALQMEWRDATGQAFTGTGNPAQIANGQGGILTLNNYIQPAVTDQNGGPFPNGELRIGKVGTENGEEFDLLITVPQTYTQYGAELPISYVSPSDDRTTQAAVTGGGYVCLGYGVKTAVCPSGATPDRITASCPSGEITIMQGGEYDVKLVRTGTSNLMPAVESLFLTFYDVDGDDTYEVEDEATGQVIEGTFYNLYEIKIGRAHV